MIIALAGRRIDAPDAATRRFPLERVTLVEQRLGELFADEGATALVSSAACGADLVASTVAGRMGLHRRVVLPFPSDRFRVTSVTDRPGDWGAIYDRLIAELGATNDLVTLVGLGEGPGAYVATNHAIFDHALALSDQTKVGSLAVVVWEGAPRGDDDTTASFAEEARRRRIRLREVRSV